MAEWSMAVVLKTTEPETVPGVRIPLSPPTFAHALNEHVDSWLAALEERHLANLTRPELTRALRALSSCYVERREKLTSGAALEGAGKRAAFALFYGPLHFLTVHRRRPRAIGARDGDRRRSPISAAARASAAPRGRRRARRSPRR